MARKYKIFGVLGCLVAGVVAIFLVIIFLGWFMRDRLMVKNVESGGEISLNDGRMILLSGIRLKLPGGDGYEKAYFLLKEMVEGKEVWVKKESDTKYSVWIGCRNLMGYVNCSNGILINEALIKAGGAEKE